jgi:nucleotide-binding universal stress UspA family protein
MFDDILFPVDGSDGTEATSQHVFDIATANESTLHILNVADTNQVSLVRVQGEVVDALEGEGEQLVAGMAERARRQGVDTVSEVRQGEPYSTILEYAESRGIDLVVMPTHGRQMLEQILLGSTTERVVRRSDVPVLTVQPDSDDIPDYPYSQVLVPTDGSDPAGAALDLGIGLASKEKSTLHIQSVVTPPIPSIDALNDAEIAALEEDAAAIVDDATAYAEDNGVSSVTGAVSSESSVHEAILSYVEDHDVELVVVGTQGRTGIDRYLLGSVAESLVRTAPVPVLTVREPSPET